MVRPVSPRTGPVRILGQTVWQRWDRSSRCEVLYERADVEEGPVDRSWSDRVVVVTGASSGIGHATVQQLAAAGATCVAIARRGDRPSRHPAPRQVGKAAGAADAGAAIEHMRSHPGVRFVTMREIADTFTERNGEARPTA
jgi:NADPH:quinone reductase-like Zn-dependent oxidoreductase